MTTLDPPTRESLSDEQSAAVDAVLNGDRDLMYIVGKAGTGKSFFLSYLQTLPRCTVCAMTGKAAIGNGCGLTMDRLFSVDRTDWRVRNERTLARNMEGCGDVILVDEGFMSGGCCTHLLLSIAARYSKRLVLVGDGAQAAPVNDTWITEDDSLRREVTVFRKNFRQGDGPFLDALDQLREGKPAESAMQLLSGRQQAEPDIEEHGVLRMFALNKMTADYNARSLRRHSRITGHQPFDLPVAFKDLRAEDLQERYPFEAAEKRALLDDSGFATRYDQLAIGSDVLITANAPDLSYINGDVGVLHDILYFSAAPGPQGTPPAPLIRWSASPFDPAQANAAMIAKLAVYIPSRGVTVEVGRATRNKLNAHKEAILSVTGFPVRLGYALSIHKSQGMSVSRAWLSMSSIRFMKGDSRHGLGYVGMSRCRTIEGLGIDTWDASAIHCDPRALPLIRGSW